MSSIVAEATGTIQNSSHVGTIEISTYNTPDSGILIYPLQKISFVNKTIYLRCVDGWAQARVVDFVINAGGIITSSSSSDTQGGSSTDEPYSSYLGAYLTFDSSSAEDLCGKSWSAFGNVTFDTTIKKDGVASVHLPNGAYLSEENIIDIEADKWTVEAWLYVVSLTSASTNDGIIVLNGHTENDYTNKGINLLSSGLFIANAQGYSAWQKKCEPPNYAVAIPTQEWTHVAFVRNGSNFYFLVNNSISWRTTIGATISNSNHVFLGGAPIWGSANDLFLDNVKIYNGVALYPQRE